MLLGHVGGEVVEVLLEGVAVGEGDILEVPIADRPPCLCLAPESPEERAGRRSLAAGRLAEDVDAVERPRGSPPLSLAKMTSVRSAVPRAAIASSNRAIEVSRYATISAYLARVPELHWSSGNRSGRRSFGPWYGLCGAV